MEHYLRSWVIALLMTRANAQLFIWHNCSSDIIVHEALYYKVFFNCNWPYVQMEIDKFGTIHYILRWPNATFCDEVLRGEREGPRRDRDGGPQVRRRGQEPVSDQQIHYSITILLIVDFADSDLDVYLPGQFCLCSSKSGWIGIATWRNRVLKSIHKVLCSIDQLFNWKSVNFTIFL